jgi:hypothetical protein
MFECPNCKTKVKVLEPNKAWDDLRTMVIDARKTAHRDQTNAPLKVCVDLETEFKLWEVSEADFMMTTITRIQVEGWRNVFPTLFGLPVVYGAPKTEVVR